MVQELARAQFQVTWERAETEAEFLRQLETVPDVILADCALPEFSAVQALHLLQRSGLTIPCIVVSGTIGEDIAVAMINFAMLFLMSLFVFAVPLKGSFFTLALGALIYVATTTAYGMLISAFTRTQIAALFGTAILTVLPATQFSGMLTPVSSLTGVGAFMGRVFPMSYFLPISVGTFTKGLGIQDLAVTLGSLAVFVPALVLLSLGFLREQER